MKKNQKTMITKVMTGAVVLSLLTSSVGVVYAQEDIVSALPTNTEQTTTTTPQSITDIKSFEDYYKNLGYGKLGGHWAEGQIGILLSYGGISGVPYGNGYRFEANREIKTVELLSIILRLSGNTMNSSGNWVEETMLKSKELGLIPGSMVGEGKEALTREKMAMILVKAEEKIRGKEVSTDYDKGKIVDIGKAGEEYQEYIREAYGIGLLAGTKEGYKPKESTTRAETCAIVNRLFGYSNRVDNSKREEVVVLPGQIYEALPDGSNVSSITGMIFPAEGQKGPDGVIISRDKETGVLGFGNGQKGGIYLGLRYPNTESIIEVGMPAPSNGSGYDKWVTGKYTQNGDYVYWDGEWARIDGVMRDKLDKEYPNPKDGMVADINGKLTTGKEGDKNVFFVAENGMWYPTFSYT